MKSDCGDDWRRVLTVVLLNVQQIRQGWSETSGDDREHGVHRSVRCLLSWRWRSDTVSSSVFRRVGTLSTSIVLPCRVSCPSTRPSPWPRAAMLQTLTFNSDNQGSDHSLAGSLDFSVTQTCMCVTSPPCETRRATASRLQRASLSSERVNRKACPQTHDAARLRRRFCQTGVRPRRRWSFPKTKRDKDCRLFWYQRRRLFL